MYRATALTAWVTRWCRFVVEVVTRRPGTVGFEVQPRRWIVERTFGWFGRYRRPAKDYETNPRSSETWITVAMIHRMSRFALTGIGSDANADGKLDISFVDKGGTHSYWHVNALDVRPLSLVSPVTVTAEGGTPANTKALPTSLTVPAVFNVVASDANNDGFLDISIAGFSTWVMNGVEVG